MTKLSIIIPVYNVEEYLRKCIESVIVPDLHDYDIVLVNDGSTDSSPEICREYSERYPELIQYVSTENGGIGAARNNGLAVAKGEYVFFLDSDDYLSKNTLHEIMPFLQEEADAFIFDMVAITESGIQIGYDKGSYRGGSFTLEEYPEFLFCPPNACNKIWRRQFLLDSNIWFPGVVWFEDLYTVPKLYLHAKKFVYVEKPWYMYLQHPGSITRNKNIHRNLEIINAVDQVINYFKSQGQYEKYKEQLEYMALYHQVITSTTRIILRDRKSDVPLQLLNDYANKFPDYRANRYIQNMSKKYKLLLRLIETKKFSCIYAIMSINDIIKRKHQ